MAWYSPFIYVPFYFFAIYAFIFEREWIRVPGIVYNPCIPYFLLFNALDLRM